MVFPTPQQPDKEIENEFQPFESHQLDIHTKNGGFNVSYNKEAGFDAKQAPAETEKVLVSAPDRFRLSINKDVSVENTEVFEQCGGVPQTPLYTPPCQHQSAQKIMGDKKHNKNQSRGKKRKFNYNGPLDYEKRFMVNWLNRASEDGWYGTVANAAQPVVNMTDGYETHELNESEKQTSLEEPEDQRANDECPKIFHQSCSLRYSLLSKVAVPSTMVQTTDVGKKEGFLFPIWRSSGTAEVLAHSGSYIILRLDCAKYRRMNG